VKRRLLIGLTLFLLVTGAATAENTNISIVQQEIQSLKQRLTELENRSRSLSEEVEYYGGLIEVLLAEREKALKDKQDTEAQLAITRKELAAVNAEIQRQTDYLKRRVRELYRKGDMVVLDMMLTPGSEAELAHAMNSFLFLAEKDRQALTRLSELKQRREVFQQELERKSRYLEEKTAELNRLHAEYRKTWRQKRDRYREIRNQAKTYATLLAERNQLLRDLMQAIAAGSGDKPVTVSVERFRKLLSLPADGPVIEKFGRVRNRRYGTWLKNNGITLRVSEGSPVHAFYDGVVVYADWYKSYGRLVIINHGDGYYSFYAHLKSFSVTINQVVTTGEMIAESGNSASVQGDVLHFEFWHQRTPLDPLAWIKSSGRP